MNFFIYMPGRKENVGGHVVLHKLAKILCDLGFNVISTQECLFECSLKVVDYDYQIEEKYLENTVVIYPEQIKYNPVHAKHVTRWILYHTKKEIEETWKESDEKFKFIPGFNTNISLSNKTLTVIDSKIEIFNNKGYGDKRYGYCHINKKKYPEGEKQLKYLKSKDLGNFIENGGFEYLSEELNKHEYFITYDDATYYSIIAALCGCKSVILNTDPKVTPEDYRNLYPIRKYGVAYGWNDIKHADLTRDLVREHVKYYEENSIEQVKNFINFWKYKINNK